jgi:predicted nucleotidyltransferase
MNHGLPDATVAKIHGVLSRHAEVERAILYGSRAKGNYKPGSDIDLTLAGSRLNEGIRGRIDEELDDLLLPYEFDLSILADLTHLDLIGHIRRIGVVFYERQPAERPS